MNRTVDTSIWHDPAIRQARRRSHEAVYLFVYLLTNSHAHICGLYHLSQVVMENETGLSKKKLDALLDILSELELAKYDAQTEVVFIKNMFPHQAKGEKANRAAARHLDSVHNPLMVKEFLDLYPAVRPFISDRVSDRVSDTLSDRVSRQDRQQQQTLSLPKPAHSPTVSEVVSEWNQMAKAHGLPVVRGKLNATRRRNVLTMLRDPDRGQVWREALEKLPSCPWPMGKNGDGWRADFDWFIRPDGRKRAPIMAIMEGKYDGQSRNGPSRPSGVARWLETKQSETVG